MRQEWAREKLLETRQTKASFYSQLGPFPIRHHWKMTTFDWTKYGTLSMKHRRTQRRLNRFFVYPSSFREIWIYAFRTQADPGRLENGQWGICDSLIAVFYGSNFIRSLINTLFTAKNYSLICPLKARSFQQTYHNGLRLQILWDSRLRKPSRTSHWARPACDYQQVFASEVNGSRMKRVTGLCPIIRKKYN